MRYKSTTHYIAARTAFTPFPTMPKPGIPPFPKAFFIDVVNDFLGRLQWKPLPYGDDAKLEKAVLTELSTWDVNDEARKILEASASVTIRMTSLSYPHLDFEPAFLITMINTVGFYVDNTVHANLTAYDKFTHRFLSREQQLDPVLEHFAAILSRLTDFYEPFAASMMGLSVCSFVSGSCIEARVNEMKISRAAVEWPWALRTLTGGSWVYAYGLFPRAQYPPLVTYVQAIPEMDRLLCMVNDILSFYKEEVAHETDNYVHTVSQVSGLSPAQVLSQTIERAVTANDRVTTILSESDDSADELVTAWQSFVRGYVAFHMQHDRYRLTELFEDQFDLGLRSKVQHEVVLRSADECRASGVTCPTAHHFVVVMSLLKIPLLLSSGISLWTALTPPHTPRKTEKVGTSINERVFGNSAAYFAVFLKVKLFRSLVVHMLTCLAEMIVIVSCHTQGNPLSLYLLHILSHATPHETYGASSSSAAANIRITPIFLAAFFFHHRRHANPLGMLSDAGLGSSLSSSLCGRTTNSSLMVHTDTAVKVPGYGSVDGCRASSQ
ncbi:hypothetical protein EW146_g6325 [Bondarzewia mesenterica]|uniref:Terpene synthase n=1 Tax=Bondarzewia mesenterica TaxID=1095465 RepID=A0A4S4LNX2_9AGAM|nr:hypothetical protein EW146_g6325 [Bondarzewia mesenterica]